MTFGFILSRHVNSETTNKYWNTCIKQLNLIYPETSIVIIDDNSNYEYITNIDLYKTTIIQSEYPQRGELLPYYYYLHNKLFDIEINHYYFLNLFMINLNEISNNLLFINTL